MFYSHEVLTSRKYGVATIWLVATLGSQSRMKKIPRRDIQKVNVSGACETIISPETPMALRLQSNLLYGVTRVYDHQCIYVLTDTQSCYKSMKALLRTMHLNVSTIDLDNTAKATRPEQLLLQDDPNFAAELLLHEGGLGLDLDLNLLHLPDSMGNVGSQESAGLSSLNTPPEAGSSSFGMPRIEIPSSMGSSGGVGGFHTHVSSGRGSNRLSDLGGSGFANLGEDSHGLLEDVGFTFDAEGNMLDSNGGMDLDDNQPATPNQSLGAGGRVPSDLSAQARERLRQHDEAAHGEENVNINMGMDLDNLPLAQYDNNADYPDAQPFPPRQHSQANQGSPSAEDNGAHTSSFHENNENNDPSSASAAPLAARRAGRPQGPRPLLPDTTTTISSATARSWQANYLSNMATATATKLTHAAPALAKKNADYWIWGRGIGGIGADLGSLGTNHPLSVFFGEKLRVRLIGEVEGSRKRPGDDTSGAAAGAADNSNNDDDGDGSDSANRRVRQRLDAETETGMGIGMGMDTQLDDNVSGNDIDLPMGNSAPSNEDETPLLHALANSTNDVLDDTQFPDLEIGRTAPTPPPFTRDDGGGLDTDISSTMPWNISASRRSRSHSQLASRLGLAGSGAAALAGTVSRVARGGRLTSASPLLGRGSAIGAGSMPFGGLTQTHGGGSGLSSSIAGDFDDLDDGFGLRVDAENSGDDANVSAHGRSHASHASGSGERQHGADVDAAGLTSSQVARAVAAKALEMETENFLAFVAAAARSKGESLQITSSRERERERAGSADERSGEAGEGEAQVEAEHVDGKTTRWVSFTALLPPETSTALVAAQALLHVLTLASKGVMVVEQGRGGEDRGEQNDVCEDDRAGRMEIGAVLWVGLDVDVDVIEGGEGEHGDGERDAMEGDDGGESGCEVEEKQVQNDAKDEQEEEEEEAEEEGDDADELTT